MSIFVNKDSRIVVQGMTGREGMKHTTRMPVSYTHLTLPTNREV